MIQILEIIKNRKIENYSFLGDVKLLQTRKITITSETNKQTKFTTSMLGSKVQFSPTTKNIFGKAQWPWNRLYSGWTQLPWSWINRLEWRNTGTNTGWTLQNLWVLLRKGTTKHNKTNALIKKHAKTRFQAHEYSAYTLIFMNLNVFITYKNNS